MSVAKLPQPRALVDLLPIFKRKHFNKGNKLRRSSPDYEGFKHLHLKWIGNPKVEGSFAVALILIIRYLATCQQAGSIFYSKKPPKNTLWWFPGLEFSLYHVQ